MNKMCFDFGSFARFWALTKQNQLPRHSELLMCRKCDCQHQINNEIVSDCPRQPSGDPAGLTSSVCYVAGLDTDGIYRVSGNLAVIQKLRFLVNHGEDKGEEGKTKEYLMINAHKFCL